MSELPKRIQRKRTKGWRMPPNTVCVTRPGKWGNPFKVATPRERILAKGYARPEYMILSTEQAISEFRKYAVKRATEEPFWLASLRGKNLACFCPLDKPCHADVLLELANREEQ